MLQNDEQLKLNIQLFAGEEGTEPTTPTVVPPVELDLSGFVKKEDLTGLETKILESIKGIIPVKIEDTVVTPTQVDPKDEVPQWAKVLIEDNNKLKAELEGFKNNGLAKKKDVLKEKFDLEDSDLADIKDEVSLRLLEKNLEKFKVKQEAKNQDIVKEELKKKGIDLSKLNEINKQDEAKQTVFKSGLDFLKIKK